MTRSTPEAGGWTEVSPDLASALAQMSQALLGAQTATTAVELVTALAVETMPDTIGAGVTLVDDQGKRSRAASDPLVEEADVLQYEFDSGPCLTAWRDRIPVRIDDLAAEVRWPEWTKAVAPLGIQSMLSVPLLIADGGVNAIGAIKVYANQPGAYDAGSQRVLELFAQQAAVLLANTQTISEARKLTGQLTAALDQRDVLAQATGILLAQGVADVRTAFGMLRSAGTRSQTTLDQVARGVVDTVLTRNADRSPT